MSVVVEVPVWWGDMDAFGHVNNTVYFRWFENARIAFFREVGWGHEGVGPILAKTDCVFRQPVVFPDTVKVEAAAEDLREDRFTMTYRVISDRLGEVAFGSGRVVAFDYANGTKAPIPAAVYEAIRAQVAHTDSGTVQ